MTVHPNSSFPLLASDQADVIRIFLDLMREGGLAGRVHETATTAKQLGAGPDYSDAQTPRELLDLD
jgi:hypothetical protein